jgi:hypothetical protein
MRALVADGEDLIAACGGIAAAVDKDIGACRR